MIDRLLGELCHQLPARTLDVAGVPLPACARCAGIYLGVLLAFIWYLVAGRNRVFLAYPGRGGAVLAGLAVLAGVVDFALAYAGSPLAGGNEVRFVLSLLAGWGGWILYAGCATALRWGWTADRKVPSSHFAGSLILLVVPGLAFVSPAPWGARVLAYGTLAGAVVLYGALNYLPFALFLHGRRTGAAARALVVLALAVLALAEIRWGYQVYAAALRMLS
jgi:uncharacterized membrane protein